MQDDDEFGFPNELQVFKSKRLLFNIEITDFNIRNHHRSWEENAFKVLNIIDDQQEINEFEKKYNLSEVQDNFFVLLYLLKIFAHSLNNFRDQEPQHFI